MQVIIDAGNSRTTLALYEKGASLGAVRVETPTLGNPETLQTGWQQLGRPAEVEAVVIASVVPSQEQILRNAGERIFGAEVYWISPGRTPSMPIHYDGPSQLGADRLANAEAAHHRLGPDVVVVDLGTALTVDLVRGGAFEGGLIFPGRGAAARALSGDAEALPAATVGEEDLPLLGHSTDEGMASGLYHGYRELVAGLIRRLRREYGPLPAVATGGGSGILTALPEIDAQDPDLTLYGIHRLYQRIRHSNP